MSPAANAFYGALSLAFPAGERFFIEAVSAFAGRLPPDLEAAAQRFVQQEEGHARAHEALNRTLADAGVDVAASERVLHRALAQAHCHSPAVQVGLTAAFEHLTAVLAHALLADPRHLAAMPPRLRGLWQWHAAEEIEHKAVAFDIFAWATRDLAPSRAWWLRARLGLVATRILLRGRWRVARSLLAHEGQDTIVQRGRLLALLLVRPGIYRQCLLPWLAFFGARFHPWQVDDRGLAAGAAGTPEPGEPAALSRVR